ncbi:hypothetical protein ACFL6S_34150 [Candidatus Poribacteria bacterium]
MPIRKTAPDEDLVIQATVNGRAAIACVRVVYGDKHIGAEQIGKFLYRMVIPGSEVCEGLTYSIEAPDEDGQWATHPSIAVAVTNDNEPPVVKHSPITCAPAEKPLRISAEVSDPSGVKWVRLRYRSVTQYQDFQTLEMLPTGAKDQYQAEVPGEHLDPKWDFMYLIEVMDNRGNGKIYPDLETEAPYVIVRLERGVS